MSGTAETSASGNLSGSSKPDAGGQISPNVRRTWLMGAVKNYAISRYSFMPASYSGRKPRPPTVRRDGDQNRNSYVAQ